MSYRIDLRSIAERELARLPPREQRGVRAALRELEAEPRHHGVAPVRGRRGVLRARSGDYRVLFKVDDVRRVVVVGRVALRDRVYKRLSDLRFD